ncbi:hypothetical protein DL765_010150 [Monosporascus sp. GIB2]|nr:hypothetical protein DL765_010150 [Monosporascus sp. GIB2]
MKGNLTGFNTNTELAHWLHDEETDFIHHLEHTMTTIDDPVRLEQYTGPAPNKAGWSKYDHATRFMVQIIQYDKENDGPCRWAGGLDDMAAGYAYEVYCFVLDDFLENRKVEQAAAELARVQLGGMCWH